MIVVADTGPLLNLAYVEMLWLLPAIHGRVIVPPQVERELLSYGLAVRELDWVEIQAPVVGFAELVGPRLGKITVERYCEDLQQGEMEALSLAIELRAGVILMDERAGRFVAERCGLGPMGTLGILGAAKSKELIPACFPILERIRRDAGAWFGERLVREFLAMVGEGGEA